MSVMKSRVQAPGILRPDIHAAHEGQGAVHHQQLAMIAHIEERHAPGQPGVQEAGGGDAAGPKATEGARDGYSRLPTLSSSTRTATPRALAAIRASENPAPAASSRKI